MARLQRIVIHCTATPAGREVTFDDIRHWHKDPPPKGNGWKHFGYHLLVLLNGCIVNLQPLPSGPYIFNANVANGAKGFNNDSLHVCYVGGIDPMTKKPADTRTEAQKLSLVQIISQLRQTYGPLPVLGHRDLPGVKKSCPCFNARKEYNHG